MSQSSIWVMDKNFYGSELVGFGNSWLFTPIVCNALYHKYIPEKRFYINKIESNFITDVTVDKNLYNKLNKLINNTSCQCDKVCWELSNQQIFFTKDKEFIANSIENFANDKEYSKELNYPEEKHIYERFYEIAKAIREIDETEYPYFIFKNTSVDDNVERWFEKYDKNKKDYTKMSLKELDEYVADFIVIQYDKITDFIPNIDYFNKC